ncbi:MAG: radical SAM protein [Archaeoglobaceae archaeon]
MLEKFVDHKRKDKVFLLRDLIEVRIPLDHYNRLSRRFEDDYIVSFGEPKQILHSITRRELVYITRESGIPLMGSAAFGLIDRGTNLIQVRPITGCNLNCIHCSVDEGRNSTSMVTDYIVEPQYLVEKLREIAPFKGDGVEAHIDGQGEPLLYPYMKELLEGISQIKEINVVSVQTNGTLLDEDYISLLESYVSRINLSLNAIQKDTARKVYRANFPLENVMESARRIAESEMDLLIAPVWLPGYNDQEMEEIIEFAVGVGAGKRYPPLGVQKYIPYKHGRKLKEVMDFKEFYSQLAEWEKKYGVKLILSPEDFGTHKRPRVQHPIRKGEHYKAKLIAEGRMQGEKLAEVKGRVVTVRTHKKVGQTASFKIVRSKDGIFLGH